MLPSARVMVCSSIQTMSVVRFATCSAVKAMPGRRLRALAAVMPVVNFFHLGYVKDAVILSA